MVTADDRAGFLLSLFYEAQDKSVPLFSLIKAAIRGSYGRNAAGQTVISTSGNGRSVSLLMPDFLKTLTPDDARRMWVRLNSIYLNAVTTLGISMPAETDSSQDQNIFGAMMASDDMQRITSYQDDFTALRYPSFGPAT